MSIKERLILGKTKEDANQIAQDILAGDAALSELMDIFFSHEMRLCQKAAWPVGKLSEKNQEILIPYFPQMIAALDDPCHDAIVRNIVRSWQFMDIPETFSGEIYDRCLSYLDDPKIPVAIRVFSMTVCANICMHYPEMADELITIISTHYQHGSSGFRGRANTELSRLHKLNNKMDSKFNF